MVKSVILSALVNMTCAPIENQRSYLYAFYPEQEGACHKAAGAILSHSTDIDNKMMMFERQIEADVYGKLRSAVPPYLYGPIVVGGNIAMHKRVVIPIWQNKVFVWIGDVGGGVVINVK